ncbi:putative Intradiol ring-cleavage dioxygenases domain-containing protein [Seiridium cardinale]|uniref:Intradiol ring-cleavage dioxygenases domain-containing protein n=1 Tax=Seiridium cardinale TaxID=138064 RepID=A0ABR2XTK2_9PEZI
MHFSLLFLSILPSVALVHAGHDLDKEIAKRQDFLLTTRRNLAHCASKIKARGLEDRAVARRVATVKALQEKRNIVSRRDLASVLATDHNATASGYDLTTPVTELFASNASCVLTPEGESGPYYVAGEYVRSDLAEDEPGIPVHYDFQFLDYTTCEPVVGAYYEIFNANSTGVYSGTSNGGNGESQLGLTWLRGIQPTDDDGVAQFDTIFAGHYAGRATHIHTILHLDATPRENGTIYDLTAQHVGQVFWDQSVRDKVELISPYSTNTNPLTSNAEDRVFAVEVGNDNDPVFNYVQLGDNLEDGFLAWLTIGIDLSRTPTTINPAAVL